MERRLAAILAADVVGYSRLMSEDEAGTVARLEGLKAEILDTLIEQHSGRIVKLMGDGFLVEFGSVVDALECAVAWQKTVEARAGQTSDDRAIRFRVGINIGDVIVKGDDVYGDGVNVAARLEGLAEPGEILVSRTVANHVKGKIGSGFEDLGEQELKNIPEPVQVFRVVSQAATASRPRRVGKKAKLPKYPVMAAALAVLIVAAGGALWLRPWEPQVEPASVERMALPLPDKPSIAVLPFANMGGDPEQEYFADGLTDDLITDLSKASGLFVIARNSTFVYKGQAVEIRRVAEDLGVRYVVEGSVRRAGDTVRVNAQLIDATTGGHVWAERFEGSINDIFAVQDEFVREIVQALAINLTESETAEIGRGQTDQVEAREAFQKGWENYLRFTPENSAKAVDHFKRAIELDPEYGRAHAALSLAYLTASKWSWGRALNMSSFGAYRAGIQYLKQAMAYPTALTYVAAAEQVLSGRRSEALGGVFGEDALDLAARAIALDPNDPEAHVAMAWAMITTGKPENGLGFVETAMRLNPQWPAHYFLARAMAYFSMNDLGRAAGILREGLERNPGAIELAPPLASMYAHLGQRKEARETMMLRKPAATERELQNFPDIYFFPYRWPQDDRKVFDRLYDGLHIAVLPLEITPSNLVEALKQDDPLERMAAARTLGRFGPMAEAVVPDLITALKDEFEDVRKEAAIALGRIGPAAEAAIPALTAMQEESLVGHYAKEALKEITGK